jgi:uncharacterized protein YndB with AHSA1/START domain
MSPALPGDQARASVSVALPPPDAFRLFTEEIALWWRRGPRYRNISDERGIIAIEPRLGGRVFESLRTDQGETVFEIGRVSVWEPPDQVCFEWRLSNFAPDERTQVQVRFVASGTGTMVTVTHRGWSAIRPDHPARHGQAVPAFIGMIGLWWGEQLTALRRQSM